MIELVPENNWINNLTKKVRILMFILIVIPQIIMTAYIGFDAFSLISFFVLSAITYGVAYHFTGYYYKKASKTWKLIINTNGSITVNWPVKCQVEDASNAIYETPRQWRFKNINVRIPKDMFPDLMSVVKNA